MKTSFKARLVSLVAVGALAGMGLGAPAVGAATPPNVDFAGTYKLSFQYEANPFQHTWLILTEDHGGSDRFHDTVAWTSSGKTITITFTSTGSSYAATYTGVQTKVGIDSKRAPGDIELGNGKTGTWFAKLVPPAP